MKDDYLTSTEQLHDLKQPFQRNSGEGPKPNDLKTDQIYVNVAMHEGRTDMMSLRTTEPNSVINTRASCLRPEDLIDSQRAQECPCCWKFWHRKDITERDDSVMITRMWASGEAFNGHQDDKTNVVVVFVMKFRRFTSNLVLRLRELLANTETFEHLDETVWDFVIKIPSQVLFIFDGVDR